MKTTLMDLAKQYIEMRRTATEAQITCIFRERGLDTQRVFRAIVLAKDLVARGLK